MPSRWLRQKFNEFEQFGNDVIHGHREDAAALVFAALLQGFSYLYSGIMQLRFWLYRKRVLHDHPLGCLIVVVGNLTWGGTGKTPVVEKFARALQERGRKVAILSRGYKSKAPPLWKRWWREFNHREPAPPRVVSDGQSVLLDSEVAGDEPYMLARNLPGVVVLVDKDRVKSGAYAIKHFGCDTLVLDDGFQYLRLKGRLNLLLVDKTNPFGNGYTIPRGILREPVKHLKRASYVFLTKSNGRRDEELEALIKQHNPKAEIIECAHRPQFLRRVGGDEQRPMSDLKGRKIACFSGIATPESFERFLTEGGARLVCVRRFLDHHRFTPEDLQDVYAEARASGAEYIVTTEKDAVRITDPACPLPLFFLRLEIEILRGADDFQDAVGKICFPFGKPEGEGEGAAALPAAPARG